MIDHLNLEITSLCNLACVICPNPTIALKRINNMMTINDIKKMLKKDDFNHFNDISIAGFGEPLMNIDIEQILEYLKNIYKCDCLRLVTNATLTNSFSLDRLFKPVDELVLSTSYLISRNKINDVDLINLELNNVKYLINSIRKVNKSIEKSMKISFNIVITNYNIDSVLNFIFLIKYLDIDIDKINFTFAYPFIGCKFHKEESKDIFITDKYKIEEYIKIINKRLSFYSSNSIDLHLVNWLDVIDCWWSKNGINVLTDGSVTKCCREPNPTLIFGNAKHESIDSILDSSKYKDYIVRSCNICYINLLKSI